MIPFINRLADAGLGLLLDVTLQNSLFLAITLLLLYFFRNQNPYFLRMVGFIALLKLFIPPFISTGSQIPFMEAIAITVTPQVFQTGLQTANNTLSLNGYIFLLWLTVVLLFLINGIRQWRRMQFISSTAEYFQNMKDWDSGMDVQVYRSAFRHSPFVFGFFKPRIILPRSVNNWPDNYLKIILAHENAHIRFGDTWFNLLQFLAQSLFFFNPLIWLFNRRFDFIREITCDNAAVTYLRQKPLGYSRGLVEIAEKIIAPEPEEYSTLHFSGFAKNLRKRIQYQLKRKDEMMIKWKLHHSLIITALFTMAIFFACNWDDNKPRIPLSDNEQKANARAENEIASGDFIPFNELTEKPEVLERGMPKYPEPVRERGIEGMVVAKMVINTEGLVEKVEIIKSLEDAPELNEAVLEAARQFKFTPARKDGQPVKVAITVPFKFSLGWNIKLNSNETIDFRGKTLTVEEFAGELKNLRKSLSKKEVTITPAPDVEMDIVNKVRKILQENGIEKVTWDVTPIRPTD